MRFSGLYAFVTAILLSLLSSCSDSNSELLEVITDDDSDTASSVSKRTVLVYMVATNSLGSYGFDLEDISEMQEAMSQYTDGECRLLVYHLNYSSTYPTLTEIRNDGAGSYITDTLVTYPSTAQASVTTARMSQVIADAQSLAPANDYGLILWSHATGSVRSITKAVATIRDYAEDNGATMPIDSLAAAIPDGTFSFIYADACYLGAIEVAYQLRNKANYFVGSPTEIPAYGMPYDQNIPCFFEDEPAIEQACMNTYSYYSEFYRDDLSDAENEAYRSITIAMVDCSLLSELASICHSIHATAQALTSTDQLQHYHLYYPHIYFDFKQYTQAISTDSSLSDQFSELLEQTVVYKACTESLFGLLTIDEDNFSGLSTYIIGESDDTNDAFYKTLDWYNDAIAQ